MITEILTTHLLLAALYATLATSHALKAYKTAKMRVDGDKHLLEIVIYFLFTVHYVVG